MLESIIFSRVNEWNKLSADCVHSSTLFKNRIYNYIMRFTQWALDKPTASLSAAISAVA